MRVNGKFCRCNGLDSDDCALTASFSFFSFSGKCSRFGCSTIAWLADGGTAVVAIVVVTACCSDCSCGCGCGRGWGGGGGRDGGGGGGCSPGGADDNPCWCSC